MNHISISKEESNKKAIGYVYGGIPTILASILAILILYYYNGNLFLTIIFIFIYLIFINKIVSRIIRYYKILNKNQKKPLFVVSLWEMFCFGIPLLFSKNGNEYVLNLFIILSISGIPFYIFYRKLIIIFLKESEVKNDNK